MHLTHATWAISLWVPTRPSADFIQHLSVVQKSRHTQTNLCLVAHRRTETHFEPVPRKNWHDFPQIQLPETTWCLENIFEWAQDLFASRLAQLWQAAWQSHKSQLAKIGILLLATSQSYDTRHDTAVRLVFRSQIQSAVSSHLAQLRY